jgi:transcription elongation factor
MMDTKPGTKYNMKRVSQLIKESKDRKLSSGDKVKIISGTNSGDTGVIDLILGDTYVIELKSGNKVEVSHNEVK